ncbi:DNA repair helicase XPB [Paenibacillus provencensis]|uniref:DNA 3'-5' helicase n=1 Tax=Paenibacillus provencensis TaxID=441151 RepID=A0ABW3PHL1_9BACL|nr:DNA repair helicase XPB [Paenibacillus sp. MER 78]MCM3126344.1 DEAD/DEAH box helicase [Paenibacillus sp. MER 78]
MNADKACIVQRDFTILLETGHPNYEAARELIAPYAELVKSPPAFHTYKMTPLTLWSAAAMGYSADDVLNSLVMVSRWNIPASLIQDIRDIVEKYGKLRLQSDDETGECILVSEEAKWIDQIQSHKSLSSYSFERLSDTKLQISKKDRGLIKQQLIRIGYPVMDQAGYKHGSPLAFSWKSMEQGKDNKEFHLREYQMEAANAFEGTDGLGGSGVLVLPCGAGKTIIGIAVMERLQCEVLILTSNTTSVRQWIREINEKTTIPEASVGEYSGQTKEVRPVTVATYQIMTHRKNQNDEFTHMKLFGERSWGLIIYDEVHLLPAPVFRATADIQATRRLGLTATLVREDGCEQDVFSLIGPKRYDMPWKELELQGWIAEVDCREVRVPMEDELKQKYLYAEPRQKFRLASENPAKLPVVKRLLESHPDLPALIIGQYVGQLKLLAAELQVPLITGATSQQERNRLFADFRRKKISTLIVSKVANFAIDLPDAALAIEVSGSYGSRQEEAQRLGRILRPKEGANKAYFYTLVTKDSREQDFALKRQMFLIEQGYEYHVAGEKEATL